MNLDDYAQKRLLLVSLLEELEKGGPLAESLDTEIETGSDDSESAMASC